MNEKVELEKYFNLLKKTSDLDPYFYLPWLVRGQGIVSNVIDEDCLFCNSIKCQSAIYYYQDQTKSKHVHETFFSVGIRSGEGYEQRDFTDFFILLSDIFCGQSTFVYHLYSPNYLLVCATVLFQV